MRKLTICACAAVAFSSVLATADTADAARRAGLAGSELIKDKDDIFQYPQLAVEYNNMVSFEYGGGPSNGNGLFLFGSDSFAAGVALHRGDLFGVNSFPYETTDPELFSVPNALGDPQTPLGGAAEENSHTIIDLMAGVDLGGGMAGGRLFFGAGGKSVDPAGGSAGKTTHTFFGLQGGYSLAGDALEIDTGLTLAVDSADNNAVPGGDDKTAASSVGVLLEGRFLSKFTEEAGLGGLFDLGFNSTNIQHEQGNEFTDARTNFSLQAGAGPVYSIGQGDGELGGTAAQGNAFGAPPAEEDTGGTDGGGGKSSFKPGKNAEIAGYVVLGYRSRAQDPNSEADDDAKGKSAIIIPGFHLAGEIQVLKWLYFRSGAKYWFTTTSSRQDSPGGETVQGADSGKFGWTAGLGVEVGNFQFDGALQHAFLTNGPYLISGAGNPLFSVASAKYTW